MMVAVPMSIMMMGTGYFSNADTALATMSAPSCWLLNSIRMFSPVLMPAPTTMGGLPRRRVSAFSIIKFIGGTTLDKIAPLTSWISQPYSVNKFIRSMLIWSAVLRLSVSMDARNFSVFSRSNSPTEIFELPISMAKSIYVLLPIHLSYWCYHTTRRTA